MKPLNEWTDEEIESVARSSREAAKVRQAFDGNKASRALSALLWDDTSEEPEICADDIRRYLVMQGAANTTEEEKRTFEAAIIEIAGLIKLKPRPSAERAGVADDAICARTARGLELPAGPEHVESPTDRQTRRLETFRKLGGDLRRAGQSWHCAGRRGVLAALVREEVTAGRPRSDKSDVRRDLAAAMEALRVS